MSAPRGIVSLVTLCQRGTLSVRTVNALRNAGCTMLFHVPRTADELFEIAGVGEKAVQELDALGWVRATPPRRNRSAVDWTAGRDLWLSGLSQAQIARALGVTPTALWIRSQQDRWPRRVLVYAFPELSVYAPRLPGVLRLMAQQPPPA